MFRRLTFTGRAVVFFFAILAVWWLLPFVVKSFVKTSFFEFQAPSWTSASYLRDIGSYWGARTHSKEELIEAGMEQARLNAAYELRNQNVEFQSRQIERLEALLSLPSLPTFRYEVARVIHRDINTWWNRLIIRKGRIHGIRPGQAVVFSGGVVGRVDEVYAYTSTVVLISDPSFRVAAHVEDDERPIQFQGGVNPPGLRAPLAQISNVPADIRVSRDRPRRVVSSRLGGSFPDGLTLGYIQSLEPGSDGLFQSGYARLDERLLSVREVTVLVPIEAEMGETTP